MSAGRAVFGLIGQKLGHSFSGCIHRALGRYDYELFELKPQELEEFLKNPAICGLNVTIPYKRAVIPYCAELSDTAKAIGSVNTLVRRGDGSFFGDNTDCAGFLYMADRAEISFAGKKVLVLGSGGTSRTVCHAVRMRGGDPVVISRSGENNYDNLERHADAAVLVNTTPVGMYPHGGESPLSLAVLPALEAVVDVVYNPLRTKLCLEAEARGLRCTSGLPMLVAQGIKACERFTGLEVDESEIERILAELTAERRNLVLIGMPGCGKTTVGRLIAQKLGRPLLDTDERIFACTGRSPAEILREQGESAFRRIEAEAIAAAGAQTGVVIATGGGAVKTPQNRDALRANGSIVWLKREISQLAVAGRPLSQGAGVEALYAERKALYEAFADCSVENDSSPESAADAVIAMCMERWQRK